MIRRWGHGHSLVGGGVAATFLYGHLWLYLLLAFTAGLLAGLALRQLNRGGKKVGRAVDARTRLEVERWKEVRARRAASIEKRKASRAALDKAYQRGVIEGSLDRG